MSRHITLSRLLARPSLALAALAIGVPASAATLKVPQHHPTLTAALAAATDGDTIVVGAGVYHENPTLVLRSNITIKGKGDVVIDADGAPITLGIGLCSEIRVVGLTLRGAADSLMLVSGGYGVEVEDCDFEGGAGDGLVVTGGERVEAVGCRFEDIPRSAVAFDTVSAYLGDCDVVNCGQDFSNPAVVLNGSFLTAEGNRIDDDHQGHAVRIGEAGSPAKNVLFVGNEVTGAGSDALVLDDATDCLIMDNVLRDAGDDGIDMQLGAIGNAIEGNLISGSGYSGIEMSDADNLLAKNRIKASGQDGVLATPASSLALFFKNKVKKSGRYGFNVQGDDHALVKNVAKGSVDYDLMVSGSDNELLGNVFGTIHP